MRMLWYRRCQGRSGLLGIRYLYAEIWVVSISFVSLQIILLILGTLGNRLGIFGTFVSRARMAEPRKRAAKLFRGGEPACSLMCCKTLISSIITVSELTRGYRSLSPLANEETLLRRHYVNVAAQATFLAEKVKVQKDFSFLGSKTSFRSKVSSTMPPGLSSPLHRICI